MKDYESYSDFAAEGRSTPDLLLHLKSIVPESHQGNLEPIKSEPYNKARSEAVRYMLGEYLSIENEEDLQRAMKPIVRGLDPGLPRLLEKSTSSEVDQRPHTFIAIRDAACHCHDFERAFIGILFIVAIVCFGYVILENVVCVTGYLFS